MAQLKRSRIERSCAKHYILRYVECGISVHIIRLFKTPDVTVKIYDDTERQIQWRISHEGLYESYVESLLPVESMF